MSTPSVGRYGVSTLPPSSETPERCRSFPNLSPQTAANEPSSVRAREVSKREPELNMKLPGHAPGDTKKSLAEHSTSGTSSKVSVSNNDEYHASIAPDGRASLLQFSDGASGTAAVKDDASSSTTLKDDMFQELSGPEGVVAFDEMTADPMVNEQELFNENYWNDFNDDESFCGEYFEENQPPKEMDKAVDCHLLLPEKKLITSFTQTGQQDFSGLLDEIGEVDESIESVASPDELLEIDSQAQKMLLWNKLNHIINDLVQRGIPGFNHPCEKQAELGTIYELITNSLENRLSGIKASPIDVLRIRIADELSVFLQFIDEENAPDSISQLVSLLKCKGGFSEFENKVSKNKNLKFLHVVTVWGKSYNESDDVHIKNGLLDLLYPVIQSNIRQASRNTSIGIATEEFNQIEKLILIYFLTIGQLTVDLCGDFDPRLISQMKKDNPVWRTKCSRLVNTILDKPAQIVVAMLYVVATIVHSISSGYISDNFQLQSIIAITMAVYFGVSIPYGSVKNSVEIFRTGQSDPTSSKPLMWLSIIFNTLKDATSLGGSVLALSGLTTPIPLLQSANLLCSTIFPLLLVYRAKESNGVQFDTSKLKHLSPLVVLPGLIIAALGIGFPYFCSDICEKYLRYHGGSGFLMHTLRSTFSNLLIASGDMTKEVNRVAVLSSISASLMMTIKMFIDIDRCESSKVKKELQSFKGYLAFRYVVTVFTALFSMADPYKPVNPVVGKSTVKPATPGAGTSQTAEGMMTTPSTVTDLTTDRGLISSGTSTAGNHTTALSDHEVEDEVVGFFFVILSILDGFKGMFWEPGVANFSRRAIKNVVREKQLNELQEQFKSTVREELSGVRSVEVIIERIVKTFSDFGLSEQLEKICSAGFKPDWHDIYETVRSMAHTLTVHRTHHSGRSDLNEFLFRQRKGVASEGLFGEADSGAGVIPIAGAKGVKFLSPHNLKSLRSSERVASETIPLLDMGKPELEIHQRCRGVDMLSAHSVDCSGGPLKSSPPSEISGRFTISTVMSDELHGKATASSDLPPKPSDLSKSPAAKNDGSLNSEPSIGKVDGTDQKVAITVAHKPGKASHLLINIPESQGEGFSALPQSVAEAHVIDIENQDADFDNGAEEQGVISSSWSGKPDIFNDLPPEDDSRAPK